MIRKHVLGAVFRRNFAAYFGNPTGYVFIAVFVVLSAAMAFWPDTFFSGNLANLDTLNRYFPYLLLFFVPAVAMGAWSEERKQGTDELLFTLPATDLEIVLGKYFAAAAIYGVSLVFSLTHVIVLLCLGSPDLGVMIGTYLGYFFLGASLLAVAMTASLLTSSMTVAFILGAIFVAVPVFLGGVGSLVGGRTADALVSVGVNDAFFDFTKGVATLKGLVYFVAVTFVFLYVNLLLLARRRARGSSETLHRLARAFSFLVIGVALGVMANQTGCRADLTRERLFSLTQATKDVIARVDAARPVYVTAYVSPEVPGDLVETRENLLGLLREIDARGGKAVEVRLVDTVKYSDEAREAEENGVRPGRVGKEEDGARSSEEIFLGVVFRCGAESVTVPFVTKGTPLEYELTRSLGTVSGLKRRKVGVVATDARIFGGLDMQTFRSTPEWAIVSELRKQYEVAQVSLDAPLSESYDALLVAMPSSLSQVQMDVLLAYAKTGKGVLLFDDPYPTFNPGLGPDKPKNQSRQSNPFMPPPPGEPKGDVRKFYDELGVTWNPSSIVWDTFNPLKKLPQLGREIVFVSPAGGNPKAFHATDPITSGLQQMVTILAGELTAKSASSLEFIPLLQSAGRGGTVLESELFTPGFFGQVQRNPNVRYKTKAAPAVLAARVKGTIPAAAPPPAKPGDPPPPAPAAAQVHAVVCADLDAISDEFFAMRQSGDVDLDFDNVTFVLNAVDVLAGDETYVELRKRRPKHRTLANVEALTKQYDDRLLEDTKKAEEKADESNKKAQQKFDDIVAAVSRRTDIDEQRKAMEIETVRQAENRKLQAEQRKIDDEKNAQVEKARGEFVRKNNDVKRGIRLLAVVLPPVPALLIAGWVFSRRLRSGRKAS